MQAGDRVKLVRGGALGWESRDWPEVAGLTMGSTYTVKKVGCGRDDKTRKPQPYITVVEDMAGLAYCTDHFELIEST